MMGTVGYEVVKNLGTLYVRTGEILKYDLSEYIQGNALSFALNETYPGVSISTKNPGASGFINLTAPAQKWDILEDIYGRWNLTSGIIVLDTKNTLYWGKIEPAFGTIQITINNSVSLASDGDHCFDAKLISEVLVVADCYVNQTNYFILYDLFQNQTTYFATSVNGALGINDGFIRNLVVSRFSGAVKIFRYLLFNQTSNIKPAYDSTVDIYTIQLDQKQLKYENSINASALGIPQLLMSGFDTYLDEIFLSDNLGNLYRISNYLNSSNIKITTFLPHTSGWTGQPAISIRVRSDAPYGNNNILIAYISSNKIYLIDWTDINFPLTIEEYYSSTLNWDTVVNADISQHFIHLVVTGPPKYAYTYVTFQRGLEFNPNLHETYRLSSVPISLVSRITEEILTINSQSWSKITSAQNYLTFNNLTNLTALKTFTLFIQDFNKVFRTHPLQFKVIDGNDYGNYLSLSNNITRFNLENSFNQFISLEGYFTGPNISFSTAPNADIEVSFDTTIQRESQTTFPSSILFSRIQVIGQSVYKFVQYENLTLNAFSSSLFVEINKITGPISLFSSSGGNDPFVAFILRNQTNKISYVYLKNPDTIQEISLENFTCSDLQVFTSSNLTTYLLCSTNDDVKFWLLVSSRFLGPSSLKNTIIDQSFIDSGFYGIQISPDRDLLFIKGKKTITILGAGYLDWANATVVCSQITLNNTDSDYDYLVLNKSLIAITSQNNMIQEWDISNPFSPYFKKIYSSFFNYSILGGSNHIGLSPVSNKFIIGALDQRGCLIGLIFGANKEANSNLLTTIDLCNIANKDSNVSISMGWSQNSYDNILIANKTSLTMYKLPLVKTANIFPKLSLTAPLANRQINLSAQNTLSQTKGSVSFNLSIWNPEAKIFTIYTPVENETFFGTNLKPDGIEYLSYTFYESMFFNGTRLQYTLTPEQKSDSEYIHLSPPIILNSTINLGFSVLDALHLDNRDYLLSTQGQLYYIEQNRIKAGPIIHHECSNIITDTLGNILVFCYDQNLRENFLYAYNKNLVQHSVQPLNLLQKITEVKIVQNYLFTLLDQSDINIYFLDYDLQNLTSVIWMLELSEIQFMSDILIITSFDIQVTEKGFRIFLSDESFGIRTIELMVSDLQYRVLNPLGAYLYTEEELIAAGLSEEESINSLFIYNSTENTTQLLLSTSLHTYLLNWSISEGKVLSLVKTFLAYSKNINSTVEMTAQFMFQLNHAIDGCRILVYNLSSNSTIESIMSMQAIDSLYFGGLAYWPSTDNAGTKLIVVNQGTLKYLDIYQNPTISFVSGEVASTYITITAANTISNSSITLKLNNPYPALTPEQKLHRLLIILAIIVPIIVALVIVAYCKFSKQKPIISDEAEMHLIEKKVDLEEKLLTSRKTVF